MKQMILQLSDITRASASTKKPIGNVWYNTYQYQKQTGASIFSKMGMQVGPDVLGILE